MKEIVVKLGSLHAKISFLHKIVIILRFQYKNIKRTPMQAVSSIIGVVSVSVDGDKITVKGGADLDPVNVMKKLQNFFPTLDTVGPVKEKKKDDKKPAGDDDKDAEAKKKEAEEDARRLACIQQMYHYANYCYPTPHYAPCYVDDTPNSCVIC